MKIKDEYQDLNMKQTMDKLKKYLKQEWIKRWDELNLVDWIEFILNYKWRYVQCKMEIYYPYLISYRLIGNAKYKKKKPKEFVNEMKTILLH